MCQAVTDSLFACSTRNATLMGPVKSADPVFLYRFDHVMSFGPAVWGANYSFCDDKVRGGDNWSSCVVAGPSSFRCRRLLLQLLAVLATLGGRLQSAGPARSLVAVHAGLPSCAQSVPCFPLRMTMCGVTNVMPPLCLWRGVQVCHGGDLPFLFGNQDASVCSRGEYFVLTCPLPSACVGQSPLPLTSYHPRPPYDSFTPPPPLCTIALAHDHVATGA